MPNDPTPHPTPAAAIPAPAPAAPKKKTAAEIAESDYDQAQLQTVRNGETIAANAVDPAYNPRLIDEGMDPATPAALVTAGQDWRTASREALEATDAKEQATEVGTDAETVIRRTVEYLRGKARLKIAQNPAWSRADAAAFRKRYFINEDIFANEATAGQSVQTILTHALADKLPGVTPAKLATYDTQLAAFTGKPSAQTGQQGLATQKRAVRDKIFEEVMRLRHEIQFTADGAWPWSDPDSRGIRPLFMLPAGRPFAG